MAVAYSYIRFSTSEQSKGDSLRRQTALAASWADRHKIRLDTKLKLRDLGVSAFTGKHQTDHKTALNAFLKLVESNKIPKGSFLIVESLDRLSREQIRPALTLLLRLIDAGIKVVQLLPSEMIFDENVLPNELILAIMELSRGHSESAMKSERVGASWKRKKREVGEGKLLTSRLPSWLYIKDKKIFAYPSAAKTIHHIYHLTLQGYGMGVITRILNKSNYKPFGKLDRWASSTVCKILNNPAVYGLYVPYSNNHGKRIQDGTPVPNYYPTIISEDLFLQSQQARKQRKNSGRGRESTNINLFKNRLFTYDNQPIFLVGADKKAPAKYEPQSLELGTNGDKNTFPQKPLEQAVLECISEIDPTQLLNIVDNTAGDLLLTQQRFDNVQTQIKSIQEKIINGVKLDSLIETLQTLETERNQLAKIIQHLKIKASNPTIARWSETKTLVNYLNENDTPDTRVALRNALKSIINKFVCVFHRVGAKQYAWIVLDFQDGKSRSIWIYWKRAQKGNPARPTDIPAILHWDFVNKSEYEVIEQEHVEGFKKFIPEHWKYVIDSNK